jgi:hypothetical protein
MNRLRTAGRKAWRKHGKAALVGAAAGTVGVAAGKALTDRKSDRNWNRGKSRVKNSLITGTGGGFLGSMLYGGRSGYKGARIGAAIGAAAGLLHDPKRRATTGATVASGGDWQFEVLPPEEKLRHQVGTARDVVGIAAGGAGILAAHRISKKANETLAEVKPWLQRTWDRDVKPVGAKIQATADQVSQTAKKLTTDVGETTRNINSVAKPVGRKLEKSARKEGTLKRWRERQARQGAKAGTRYLGKQLPAAMGGGWRGKMARVATAPARWLGKSMMLQDEQAVVRFENRRSRLAEGAAAGTAAGAVAGGVYLPGRAARPGEDLTGKRVARRTVWPFVQHEGIGVGKGRVAEVFHRGLSRNTPSHTQVVSQEAWPKGRQWKVLDETPSRRAAGRAMKGVNRPWNYCLISNNCQHWTEQARTGVRPAVSRQLRQVGKGAAAGALLAGAAVKGMELVRGKPSKKVEMADRRWTTRFASRSQDIKNAAARGAAEGAAVGTGVVAAGTVATMTGSPADKAKKLMNVVTDRKGGATRNERWVALKKASRIAGREVMKRPGTLAKGAAIAGALGAGIGAGEAWMPRRKAERQKTSFSAFFGDTAISDLPKAVRTTVAKFVKVKPGVKVCRFGMVLDELVLAADPANLATAREHLKSKSKQAAATEFYSRQNKKFILVLNGRVVDGHHFIALAERAGATSSLQVLDLTPVRFQLAAREAVTQLARGEYLDAQGRHVSAWDVLTGTKQAYGRSMDPGTGRYRVDINAPKEASLVDAAGAVHGKAKAVTRWGGRATGMAKDAGDVLAGKPRARDASGRPVKREWEKPWFQRHAKELLTTAALVGGGIAYRRNPLIQKHVNAATESVANHANKLRRRVGFESLDPLLTRLVNLTTVRGFDVVAEEAGWDVRDPRGRSARVFAPGARSRERREKKWHEKADNERKLWAAGVAASALAGAGVTIAAARRKPGLLGLRKAPVVRQRARTKGPQNVVKGRFPKVG